MIDKMENNSKHKNCVVFTTHKLDDNILRYLRFIKTASDGVLDLVVLYDCSVSSLEKDMLKEFDFFLFDSSKLPRFFYYYDRSLPNPLVALVELAKHRKYDHYLLMENDIVLNGNLANFFKRMNATNKADYIHIATDVMGGPLRHWPVQYIIDSPFENLYFAWSQVFFVSKRYLDELEKFMQRNGSFYYEFLLPTLAYNRHFSIRQFESYGYHFEVSWGPTEKCEDKFRNHPQQDTFYHPIKNLSLVKGLDFKIV